MLGDRLLPQRQQSQQQLKNSQNVKARGGGSEVQKTLFSVRSYWMQNLSSKSIFFTELKNNRLVKNGGQKRKDRYRAFSTFLI